MPAFVTRPLSDGAAGLEISNTSIPFACARTTIVGVVTSGKATELPVGLEVPAVLLPNADSVPFAFSRNSSMPDWFARTTSVPAIATSPEVPLSAVARLAHAEMAPVVPTAQLSTFDDVERNTRPGAGKTRAHPTVFAMPPGERPALNVSTTAGVAGVARLTR